MATHDDQELDQWTDDRMATLEPTPEHQPDVEAGLRRLEAGRTRSGPSLGTWLVGGAAVVWVGVMLVAVGPFGGSSGSDAGVDLSGGPSTRLAPPAAAPAPAATGDRREPPGPQLIAAAEREAAPAFSVPDTEGAEATLGDYDGRVLLLNFWATWCQPCKAEMPWFVAFEDVFADEGFAVLGVSVDQPGWDVVRPFLEERPVNYRIALADTAERAAPFGRMNILPTTWLIDRQGRIAASHIGIVDRESMEAEIRQLLAE